jgi:hypothetical protein
LKLIQAGSETLYSGIHQQISFILKKGGSPQQWTESICTSLQEGNNYQGISLLSTSNRILSEILFSSLSPYIDEIIGD